MADRPEGLSPSFFELTSTMAFRCFADEKVDVAVIETGLGAVSTAPTSSIRC